jgi:anti-sigma B factor antagonist
LHRSSLSSPASGLRCVLRPDRSRVVLALAGELDVATVDDVDRHLVDLRASGFDHLRLELRDLTFMGSVGLGLVLRWSRRAAQEGWRLDVVGDRGAVQRVMRLTGVRALL